MSKYLISTSEIYRVDSESEVEQIINEAKQGKYFTLSKYKCEHREKKQKGEVIDDWYRVQLDKVFTDEKEPEKMFAVDYKIGTIQEEKDYDEF